MGNGTLMRVRAPGQSFNVSIRLRLGVLVVTSTSIEGSGWATWGTWRGCWGTLLHLLTLHRQRRLSVKGKRWILFQVCLPIGSQHPLKRNCLQKEVADTMFFLDFSSRWHESGTVEHHQNPEGPSAPVGPAVPALPQAAPPTALPAALPHA